MEVTCIIRPSELEENELDAIQKAGFRVVDSRSKAGDFNIARYCALPFYNEFEQDLAYYNKKLINSYYQHCYVADLGKYYYDLLGETFPTWESLDVTPKDQAPFVLKGATNSKKHLWKTHMYAETWEDAVQVYLRLQQDSLIGTQQIYIRKYVELVRLGITITNLPITKEFRLFIYKGEVISSGFYWSSFEEDIDKVPEADIPEMWLTKVIEATCENIPYYVMDVAQDTTGKWWVVELNDAQMSGLSGNDPYRLYSNLHKAITNG